MTDKPDTTAPSSETPPPEKESPFAFLDWLPWEKITMWGLFLGAVYVLRSFFFIVFMTFIVAYTMRGLVVRVSSLFGQKNEHVWLERVLSLVCFAALLAAIGALGRYFGPELYSQGEKLIAKVDTLVGNPQEKLDDVLVDVVGPFLVSEKYGESGDDAYDEEFKKYQDSGLQSGAYEAFVRQLRTLETDFVDEFEKKRVEEVTLDGIREPERTQQLIAFVLEVDKEVIWKATSDAYERESAASKAKDPAFVRPPWDERSPGDQKMLVDRHVGEILSTRRQDYERRWLAKLQEDERQKVRNLKQDDAAEFASLFRDFYEVRRAEEGTDLIYDFERFRELRDAIEGRDYADAVIQFSAIVGEELPEHKDETPEERAERLLAEFDLWLREKEVAEWKKGELYKNISKKTDEYIGEGLNFLAAKLGVMVSKLLSLPVQLALSLLLSLFIVFDIHRLKKGVRRLKDSRLSTFYEEISPGLISFGKLIGRAFQAQAVIAIFNTILTFLAIRFLDIQNEAFLCSIVFVCSFIPVLGVVLSSVPIAIMAIVQDGGSIMLAIWAIVAILVIHFIETSALNPKILGEMLHLHPVLVLAILAIGEHFFGVWGLLLGVPVIVYIIRFVILDEGIPGIIEPIRKQRELAASGGAAAAAVSVPPAGIAAQKIDSVDHEAEDDSGVKVVTEERSAH